jgi:acyl carrier protein
MNNRYVFCSSEGDVDLIALLSDILQIDIDGDVPDISRNDLEMWDSISHLRFIMELESIFGISIADDEAIELSSLSQSEQLLLSHGIHKAQGMG